jgi:hypothetical protein
MQTFHDPFDPEEVVLLHSGFRSAGHWEAFRSWGVMEWADHMGTNPTDLEYHQLYTHDSAHSRQAYGG